MKLNWLLRGRTAQSWRAGAALLAVVILAGCGRAGSVPNARVPAARIGEARVVDGLTVTVSAVDPAGPSDPDGGIDYGVDVSIKNSSAAPQRIDFRNWTAQVGGASVVSVGGSDALNDGALAPGAERSGRLYFNPRGKVTAIIFTDVTGEQQVRWRVP